VAFIPRPVIVGFTNGIAVLIASTQIRDFFGLQLPAVPGSFWPRLVALAEHARSFSPTTTALAVGALVCMLAWNRVVRAIPGYIVVLLAGTVVVVALKLPVETIGSRFGGIPRGWPPLILPKFHVSLIPTLASPALTIALLGAMDR
jgi:SulP family sulfate permease